MGNARAAQARPRVVFRSPGQYRQAARPSQMTDDFVRVTRVRPEGPYSGGYLPDFYDVTPTWAAREGTVPCTPERYLRWRAAADAYLDAVDRLSQDLHAAERRLLGPPRWWSREWWRDRGRCRELRRRFAVAVPAADEAYAPVRREIEAAVRREEERRRAERIERERRWAAARRRKERLAAREVWGWAALEGGEEWRIVYVFRHDVPQRTVPAEVAAGRPRLDVRGLRAELVRLGWRGVTWNRAALRKTSRELGEGLSFAEWWRELFDGEDYRTGEPPQPPRGGASWRPGGTGTAGSGGFADGGSGGFSVHGV